MLEEAEVPQETLKQAIRKATLSTKLTPGAVRGRRSRTRACSRCWTL